MCAEDGLEKPVKKSARELLDELKALQEGWRTEEAAREQKKRELAAQGHLKWTLTVGLLFRSTIVAELKKFFHLRDGWKLEVDELRRGFLSSEYAFKATYSGTDPEEVYYVSRALQDWMKRIES